jgi:K+-transporting ATPase ATPase C chain
MNTLRPALVVTLVLLVLCTAAYPALITGVAALAFPDAAAGSLVRDASGRVRGSELIGQTLADPTAHPEYVWGRPSGASVDSATGVAYSAGSNYGPLNPALHDEVKARVDALRATGVTGPIPVDLVTKSASGLDPHLSIAAVRIQVPRIARARGTSAESVLALVAAHTEGSTLGLLGEPRVNVLALNLALDARFPRAGGLHGSR